MYVRPKSEESNFSHFTRWVRPVFWAIAGVCSLFATHYMFAVVLLIVALNDLFELMLWHKETK